MPPQQPQVARYRYRMLGNRRRVVTVRQAAGAVGHNVFKFEIPLANNELWR